MAFFLPIFNMINIIYFKCNIIVLVCDWIMMSVCSHVGISVSNISTFTVAMNFLVHTSSWCKRFSGDIPPQMLNHWVVRYVCQFYWIRWWIASWNGCTSLHSHQVLTSSLTLIIVDVTPRVASVHIPFLPQSHGLLKPLQPQPRLLFLNRPCPSVAGLRELQPTAL